MKLGRVQIDMTPEDFEIEIDGDEITITGVPNTPAMKERAVRRAQPKMSMDGTMMDLVSSQDALGEQLVEVVKSWKGAVDDDGNPLGCNNENKRAVARAYPVSAIEIVRHYDELYEERLKEREEDQGN